MIPSRFRVLPVILLFLRPPCHTSFVINHEGSPSGSAELRAAITAAFDRVPTFSICDTASCGQKMLLVAPFVNKVWSSNCTRPEMLLQMQILPLKMRQIFKRTLDNELTQKKYSATGARKRGAAQQPNSDSTIVRETCRVALQMPVAIPRNVTGETNHTAQSLHKARQKALRAQKDALTLQERDLNFPPYFFLHIPKVGDDLSGYFIIEPRAGPLEQRGALLFGQ